MNEMNARVTALSIHERSKFMRIMKYAVQEGSSESLAAVETICSLAFASEKLHPPHCQATHVI